MIHPAGGELVQRLFERLLAAVGSDHEALTIGDVYQRLIPYRSIRSEIGVMELATYEHALLRLLGGEGGYLEVDLESAAAEIRRELASPNPILGMYRDYAEVPVRIAAASDSLTAPAGEVAPPASADPPPDDTARLAAHVEVPSFGQVESPPSGPTLKSLGVQAFRETAEPGELPHPGASSGTSKPAEAAAAATAPACRRCNTPLPAVDGARFCPFCGQMREPVPCDSCGTPIQPEWNFCIRCGTPARA